MENTLKSNLILPSNYYELDREEMSYVEGGKSTVLLSYSAEQAVAGLISIASLAAVCYGLTAIYSLVADPLLASGNIPCIIGGLVFKALAAITAFFSTNLLGNLLLAISDCVSKGKGFAISIDYAWIIPISLSVSEV